MISSSAKMAQIKNKNKSSNHILKIRWHILIRNRRILNDIIINRK